MITCFIYWLLEWFTDWLLFYVFASKLNSELGFLLWWRKNRSLQLMWMECALNYLQEKITFSNNNISIAHHIRLRLRFKFPFFPLSLHLCDVIVFVLFCFNISMTFCWHYLFGIVCVSSEHYSKLNICVDACIVLFWIEYVLRLMRMLHEQKIDLFKCGHSWSKTYDRSVPAFSRFFHLLANFNGQHLKKWAAKKSNQFSQWRMAIIHHFSIICFGVVRKRA